MDEKPKDNWSNGDLYEGYMGRWSRRVAREFIQWLKMPTGSQWLDVGCGTGALSQTILQLAEPARIKGIDRSEGFVDFARERVRDDLAQIIVIDRHVGLPIYPSGTRPKGEGMELTSILFYGVVEFPNDV